MSLAKIVSDYKATKPKDITAILVGYQKYHHKLVEIHNNNYGKLEDKNNYKEVLLLHKELSIAIANLNDVKEKKLGDLSWKRKNETKFLKLIPKNGIADLTHKKTL